MTLEWAGDEKPQISKKAGNIKWTSYLNNVHKIQLFEIHENTLNIFQAYIKKK